MKQSRINLRVCRRCPDCEAQPKNGGCWGPSRPCRCLINGEDIHKLAEENRCPADKFPGPIRRLINSVVDTVISKFSKAPQPSSLEINGPLLWGELHRWALHGDIDRPLLWLAKFREKLAALSCNCVAKWDELCAKYPVPLDRDGLFAWTVDRHNDVNRCKAKPMMTVEEARQRWN
jgi:hypothetical protein